MNRVIKVSVLVVSISMLTVIVAGCSTSFTPDKESPITRNIDFNEYKVMIFQSPSCGCCEDYKGYLTGQGFNVETTYVQQMSSIKEKYQIPRNMESCHTTIIGDYFVEGHMPVEAIKKLLGEKPDIDGIALPGMPSGSPGMSGQKKESFRIYALLDSTPSDFMVID